MAAAGKALYGHHRGTTNRVAFERLVALAVPDGVVDTISSLQNEFHHDDDDP